MTSRIAVSVLLALACVVVAPPALAQPGPDLELKTVRLARSAGVCPGAVTIALLTRQYEGGAEFEATARTGAFAAPAQLTQRSAKRVVFRSPLKPAFAACEANGRFEDGGFRYTFALHRGAMQFVFDAKGLLQLMGARVVRGSPQVKTAIAD